MKKITVGLLGIALALAVATPATATPAAAHAAAPSSEGRELIGKPAQPWPELRFLGTPLKLEELRGKVVLLRWWSDACPMCSGALPNLGRLYEQHKQEGLIVIGIYHPKPPVPLTAENLRTIKSAADAHEARFPIATDADWTVLQRYWLHGGERGFTSPSFLIDRRGIIRWVHPGGELHPSEEPDHKSCDRAYSELTATLATLLREPPPPAKGP